jgi:hypothetical protein
MLLLTCPYCLSYIEPSDDNTNDMQECPECHAEFFESEAEEDCLCV